MTYRVFYCTESTDENVAPKKAVTKSQDELPAMLQAQLIDRQDFLGIIDEGHTTMQFMRGGGQRVWMEIPDPVKQGSFGKHCLLSEAIEIVKSLDGPLNEFKEQWTFQSWTPKPGQEKLLAITPDQAEVLIPGTEKCFATDDVTVSDLGVGYMYREEPDFDEDSGWRLFSGHEDQEYLDDPENWGIYDLNLIANYDSDILPLIDEAIDSHWERNQDNQFSPVTD